MSKTAQELHKSGGNIAAVIGDTPEKVANPFHLHFTGGFRTWLETEGLSLALTTYEGAKLILIGPGLQGGTVVTERNFQRCMALHVQDHRHIYLSTNHHIWKLENGLEDNHQLDGWDRVYLPRSAHVTGGVDIHDLNIDKDDNLLGVVTQYNCVAQIGGTKGSFAPVWKPPFISKIISEDRCHLNGFCLEDGALAYVSIVSQTNEKDAWREQRHDGGVIMDARSNDVIADGLAMPHTPRLHDGKLWFLEAGRGWICRIDLKTGAVEKLLWRPGFLRGLRFFGRYALVCSSEPRDKTFKGLPLQDEIEKRGEKPRCALEVLDTKTMKIIHSVEITGSVRELYDVAVLPNCRQPMLYGVEGDDIKKIVVLGPDKT